MAISSSDVVSAGSHVHTSNRLTHRSFEQCTSLRTYKYKLRAYQACYITTNTDINYTTSLLGPGSFSCSPNQKGLDIHQLISYLSEFPKFQENVFRPRAELIYRSRNLNSAWLSHLSLSSACGAFASRPDVRFLFKSHLSVIDDRK